VDAATDVGVGAAEVDVDDPNSPSMSSTVERGAGAADVLAVVATQHALHTPACLSHGPLSRDIE